MSRRKVSGKRGSPPTKTRPGRAASGAGVLNRLAPEEASTVLGILLKRHPGLRVEAEQVATELVASASVENIAADVFDRVTGVPLDALEGRAGAHSWGYVEPGQAAMDLLA